MQPGDLSPVDCGSVPGPSPPDANVPAIPPSPNCLRLRLTFVHNPYSFHAFEFLLEDSPPSPRSENSCTSDRSSVGSCFVASAEARTPPPGPGTSPRSPGLPDSPARFPHRSPFAKATQRRSSTDPTVSPARQESPAQWRRHGNAVSHVEALKDLQAFTKQNPFLPPPTTPFPVRVGPPTLAAPPAPPSPAAPIHISLADDTPSTPGPAPAPSLGAILHAASPRVVPPGHSRSPVQSAR
eukprot:EG_transcript_4016